MPVCDVCEGEDYYEEDGQFYCSVCNTQSQNMVVMETEEIGSISIGLLREIGKERKQKAKSSEYVAGRPWTKYEAYQLILQAQANALIAKKADSSLREIILRLWAKYLSLLEVAFVDEEKVHLIPKGLERCNQKWHRELYRGGLENPEVNPKTMKRRLKKNEYSMLRSKSKMQRREEQMEINTFADILEGETFYEGDNPMKENTDVEELDEDSGSFISTSDEFDSSDDASYPDGGRISAEEKNTAFHVNHSTPKSKSDKLGKQAALDAIQHMNMPKTLAFTYLGCILASRWITVSDILRWVCDGTLPYLETTHVLHDDMKLSAFDQHLFRPIHVSSALLRFETGRLLQFLGIRQIPTFPLKYICTSTTLSLDLPEALVPEVIRLCQKCPVDISKTVVHQKALPNVDALCAAYVLVATKQIFGLNDNQERLLSEYTRQIEKQLPGLKLFDWCAWQMHVTRKFLPGLCLQKGPMQGITRITDVDTLCEIFKAAGYKEQTFSNSKLYTKKRFKKVPAFQQENRSLLKRTANMLEERWKNREAIASRMRAEGNAAKDISDMTPQEMIDDFFRSSSLEHILDSAEFLYSHLGNATPSRTADKSFTTSTSPRSPIASSSLFLDASHASTFKSSPSSSFDSSIVQTCLQTKGNIGKKTEDNEDSNQSGQHLEDPELIVSQLLEMRISCEDEYFKYPRLHTYALQQETKLKELRLQQHRSYKWFLKVLSYLTYCPETEIEQMVWAIEESIRNLRKTNLH